MATYSYNSSYDNLKAIGTDQVTGKRNWTFILGGNTTSTTQAQSNLHNIYVAGTSGFGDDTSNSLAYVYQKTMSNGIAVNGGSLAAVGRSGILSGATALYGASIEAVGQGTVLNGIVGSSGAIFAGAVSLRPNDPNAPYVNGPGTAINPSVGSGGYALVGGGAADFIVKGFQVNGSGGLMVGGTFNPGSLYGIGNGGTGTGGTIFGSQSVFSNGLSQNQIFVGNDALQTVVSNGLSSKATIIGGTLLNSGGTTSGATISSGGQIRITGGTYVTWLNAGYQSVTGGYGLGTSYDDTITSGGTEVVGSDGTVYRSVLSSGAVGTILGGGTSLSANIAGGTETVSSGGILSTGTVSNNGSIFVSSGGYASSVDISQGYVEVTSGGIGSEFSASNGGTIQIDGGASVSHPVVNSGGTLTIASGAVISNGATINASPDTSVVVPSGATADYVVTNNGTTLITPGATILNDVVYATGSGTTLLSGSGATIGTALAGFNPNSSLASRGTIAVSNGGVLSAATVQLGGAVILGSGGTVGGTLSLLGGTGSFLSGGKMDTTTPLQVSGISTSMPMGTWVGAPLNTVTFGAALYVDSGYNFTEIDVGSKATATINGGTVGTFTIGSGGTDTITGGASVTSLAATSGLSTISGGTVDSFTATGGTNNLAAGASINTFNVTGGVNSIGSGVLVNTLSAGPGASLALASGASVSNVTLNGVNLTVPQGGAGITLLSALNGATSIISSGARIDSVFLSSGNATVTSGAFISRLTIMSGASGVLNSGASVQHVEVANGGWVSGARIANNSELAVSSGGTALQTLVTFDAGTGQHSGASYTMVQSGGTLSGASIIGASGAISSNNLGGLLTVASGAVLLNTSMGYNARIKVDGLKYSNSGKVTIRNGTLTVTENGQTWAVGLQGNYDATGFVLNDDGQGNTIIAYQKCFLAGSMIRTPKGEKAVERLRKGEQINVFVDGREETRDITAVIQRRARVNTSRPEDMAGWSVLIAKDAFGEGLPNKDLSVTPEHCFYFEGRFVPARMLVNGTSIRYDHSQVEYDYYHVQTEPHSVIWANGVLTESWLDTDEEDLYKPEDDTSEDTLKLAERHQLNWDDHAAAPLDVSQTFVKPLHDRFAARAVELGIAEAGTSHGTPHDGMTADPAPYIRLPDGRTIRPQRHEAGRYLFALPAHARQVTLGSRTFRPSESIGPHVDDRRELGILVGQVSLWVGEKEHIITRHLTEKNLKGWDVIEAGPHRWTQGEAELLLHDAPAASVGQNMLSIEVQAGGPYRQV